MTETCVWGPCGLPRRPQGPRGPAPRYCTEHRYATNGGRNRGPAPRAGGETFGPCPRCGALRTSARAKTCGADECRRAHRAETQREWMREHRETTGERYATRYRLTDPAYREALADGKARRRALEAGAEVGPVERLAVFEADDYVCQLCDLPTSLGVDTNHDLHPSLDHVVPLVLGGSHASGNLQTAHRVCNATKGDRTWTPELREEARARVARLLSTA